MSAPDHFRYESDPAPYLLGALPDDERRAFEAHLGGCALCAEEVESLRPAAEALARAVTPLAAPATLKRSLMQAVEAEAPARAAPPRPTLRERLGRLVPRLGEMRPAAAWVSAAFLLAVGVLAGYGVGRGGGGETHTVTTGAHTVTAQADRTRVPEASASLRVFGDGRDGAVLTVRGLPRLPRGRVYQAWVQRGKEIVPQPTFDVGRDGSAAAAVTYDLRGATAVMVTAERRGGAEAPSEAPLLRAGL